MIIVCCSKLVKHFHLGDVNTTIIKMNVLPLVNFYDVQQCHYMGAYNYMLCCKQFLMCSEDTAVIWMDADVAMTHDDHVIIVQW